MNNDNQLNEPLILEDGLIISRNESTISSHSININSNSSNSDILFKLFSLASPLIFGFLSYILWSSLVYYCVSTRSIEITEGKAILFMYYYTIIISIFWGYSIGFEIKGSQAFGINNKKEIEKLLAANYTIYMFICSFFMFISIFVAPYVISKLPFNLIAIENFKTEIRLLAFTFPQLSLLCIMSRLGNLLQRNMIFNKAIFISSIIHVLGCFIFIKWLEFDSYGMGLSYFCTYTVNTYIILKDFVDYKPLGIEIFSIKPLSPFDPYVISNFIYTTFPAMNYFILLISLEINSLLSLSISNLDFTVMSIFINIYAIISQLFEAITNAMTILISYFVGRKNEFLIWRIWKITVILSIVLASSICGVFYIFSENIFLLFSRDQSFGVIANYYSNYLIGIILIGSWHFVFSEFILVCGYTSFPAKTSIILRLGIQLLIGVLLIFYFALELNSLMILWLIVTISSVLTFVLKVLMIKLKGIDMNIAGHSEAHTN